MSGCWVLAIFLWVAYPRTSVPSSDKPYWYTNTVWIGVFCHSTDHRFDIQLRIASFWDCWFCVRSSVSGSCSSVLTSINCSSCSSFRFAMLFWTAKWFLLRVAWWLSTDDVIIRTDCCKPRLFVRVTIFMKPGMIFSKWLTWHPNASWDITIWSAGAIGVVGAGAAISMWFYGTAGFRYGCQGESVLAFLVSWCGCCIFSFAF